jgi:hypothetical protein
MGTPPQLKTTGSRAEPSSSGAHGLSVGPRGHFLPCKQVSCRLEFEGTDSHALVCCMSTLPSAQHSAERLASVDPCSSVLRLPNADTFSVDHTGGS